MTPFQALLSAEMFWLCAVAAVALLLYWQRGRIQQYQPSSAVPQYKTITDTITVEALYDNAGRKIREYEAIGYQFKGIERRGSIQRITLAKDIKVPINVEPDTSRSVRQSDWWGVR